MRTSVPDRSLRHKKSQYQQKGNEQNQMPSEPIQKQNLPKGKETHSILCKQFIRNTIHHAYQAWFPTVPKTNS